MVYRDHFPPSRSGVWRWWLGLCVYDSVPLVHGVFTTTHFLLSAWGPQGWEVRGPRGPPALGPVWRGCLSLAWEPFLKPHVLFFFMQGLHALQSPSSHSTTGWPAWDKAHEETPSIYPEVPAQACTIEYQEVRYRMIRCTNTKFVTS